MAMAKPLALQLGLILAVLLVSAPFLSTVEAGINVSFKNDMSENVRVYCYINKATGFGDRVVAPGAAYYFLIPDSAGQYSGRIYHCNFSAGGKPITYLKVFAGTGGLNNEPCQCLGDFCNWSIANTGFTCLSGNHWYHRWGN